jgi:hypothetical protein
MSRSGRCFGLALGLALVAPSWSVSYAADSTATPHGFVADLGFGYLSGDYGGSDRASVESVTARLRWLLSRGEVRLSLPWHRLTDATLVGGLPVSRVALPALPGATDTVSGIGDSKVRGELFLVRGTATRPWVSLLGEVKLPTGNEEQGLGTGEPDYTAGIGLIQPLGRVSLLADAGRTLVGSPTGTALEDVTSFGAGLSLAFGPRRDRQAFVYFEDRTHPVPDLDDRRDVTLGGQLRIGRGQRTSLSGSVILGLSDTAEDYGVALTFGRAL